jgi:23S rRNA (uracil1939-C5)-methyltransferase
MFVERKIVGRCVDYAHDGRGVVKHEGIPIFVENLLMGEEAEILITERKKGFSLGRRLKLLTVSSERIKPTCEIYKFCGGCQLQHMTYAEQLRFKQTRVEEVLKRIAEIDVEVEPIIGMQNPWRYRHKVQVPFGTNPEGKLIAGFYQKGTHQIIDMEKSYIEDEEADRVLVTLKKLCKQLNIEPADVIQRKGVIRYVLIRKSRARQELMVVLITRTGYLPKKQLLLEALLTAHPNIRTIVLNVNSAVTNVVLGEEEHILYGPGFIEDELNGLRFRISAKSFFQVNPEQTEILYQTAMDYANLSNQIVAFDAYCGVGTIGLIAAKQAKSVIGVEVVPAAVKDARINAELNQIRNIQFFCDDAAQFMVKMASRKEKVDVVFVDPPRNGCGASLIQSLITMKPSRIVYISCEPSSLARDLKLLKEVYKVEKVQPVDMFPQTYHVESITLLSLK